MHERVYLQLFLFRDVAKIFLFWKMHMHIITGGIGFSVLAILLKLPRLNIHANCIKGERVLCKLSNIHMQHMRFTAVFYSTESNSEALCLTLADHCVCKDVFDEQRFACWWLLHPFFSRSFRMNDLPSIVYTYLEIL